jgi:hypothetical protein
MKLKLIVVPGVNMSLWSFSLICFGGYDVMVRGGNSEYT